MTPELALSHRMARPPAMRKPQSRQDEGERLLRYAELCENGAPFSQVEHWLTGRACLVRPGQGSFKPGVFLCRLS